MTRRLGAFALSVALLGCNPTPVPPTALAARGSTSCDPLEPGPYADRFAPLLVTDPHQQRETLTGYKLYWSADGGDSWGLVADLLCLQEALVPCGDGSPDFCLIPLRCPFEDVPLPPARFVDPIPETRAWWTVTAYNAAGESAPSNVVSFCWSPLLLLP